MAAAGRRTSRNGIGTTPSRATNGTAVLPRWAKFAASTAVRFLMPEEKKAVLIESLRRVNPAAKGGKHMPNFIDLTGQRFGDLVVLNREANSPRNEVMWRCRCEACGKEIITRAGNLRSGTSKSCGCTRAAKCGAAAKITNTKHGASPHRGYTKLYNTWLRMKGRCNNPNATSYKYYGGRGITVCLEWQRDFAAFRDWANAHGYKEGLSIDRIDPNGNYEPSNCRWITMAEQQRNKRNTKNRRPTA